MAGEQLYGRTGLTAGGDGSSRTEGAVNQAADLPTGLWPDCRASARLAVLDSQITAAASRKPMIPKTARAMRASISIGIECASGLFSNAHTGNTVTRVTCGSDPLPHSHFR